MSGLSTSIHSQAKHHKKVLFCPQRRSCRSSRDHAKLKIYESPIHLRVAQLSFRYWTPSSRHGSPLTRPQSETSECACQRTSPACRKDVAQELSCRFPSPERNPVPFLSIFVSLASECSTKRSKHIAALGQLSKEGSGRYAVHSCRSTDRSNIARIIGSSDRPPCSSEEVSTRSGRDRARDVVRRSRSNSPPHRPMVRIGTALQLGCPERLPS